jgi:hypothetical protein
VEKLVYVVWPTVGTSRAELRDAILGEVAGRCRQAGARGMAASLVDDHVEHVLRARITRLDPPPAGIFSLWLDCCDDRAPCEEALAEVSARHAGYLVVESVPLVNETRRVPAGERTPGVNMLALIERPARVAWEDWIRIWHEQHKLVALETQCTFAYVRNTVVRRLTPDAPPWAGIVEEGFPAEAVTNPMLWYKAEGDPQVLARNAKRMIESCRAFLDLERVESHPTSEYRLGD